MENMKNLSIKIEGNEQIISLLARNEEIVKMVSKFQVAVEELNAKQKKLEYHHALLGKDLTPVEKVKNDRRKALEDTTIVVARIMQVFAHDKEKSKLQAKLFHITSEYIQNCLDMELIKLSKNIWLMANKHGGYALTFVDKIKSALNPDNLKITGKFEKEFGLNQAMLRDIEEANISFIEAMLRFEDAMNEKEDLLIKIKKINKQIKKLLADKIDHLTMLFEKDHPNFYNEYQALRDKQLQKQPKESNDQETDFAELLLDNNLVKPAPKTGRAQKKSKTEEN